jgi:hypothetical protein
MTAPAERASLPGSMKEIADAVRELDRARTVADVIADLERIQIETSGSVNPGRRQLARDGVACFNFMYLAVTKRVAATSDFADNAFVKRLAVVFAEYYFVAYRASSSPDAYLSKAWEPLFERRHERGILPLQFAIAGMNAHINNDLAWALVQVWQELGVDPARCDTEHDDFDCINDMLAEVQQAVRARLQAGFLRWLDRVLRRLDDRVAGFSIEVAREEAWQRAAGMAERLDVEREVRHERQVGFGCHVILEPHLDFL